MLRYLIASAIIPLAACAANIGDQARAAAPLSDQDGERDAIPSRTIAAQGFDRIALSGCDRVEVAPGGAFAVMARGPQRDLDLLESDRRDDTLILRRRPGGCRKDYVPLTITVRLPALRAIRIEGAGKVAVAPFAAERFEADISGAGTLDLAGLSATEGRLDMSGAAEARLKDLRLQRLDLRLSGAGEIDGQGYADALAIKVSGAGDIDLRDLIAETLAVSASGAGEVRARASGIAAINASGMADVRVTGGATCTIDRSGIARVTCD